MSADLYCFRHRLAMSWHPSGIRYCEECETEQMALEYFASEDPGDAS